MGQNALKATILYNESKHNILAYQGKANKQHWVRKSLTKLEYGSIWKTYYGMGLVEYVSSRNATIRVL